MKIMLMSDVHLEFQADHGAAFLDRHSFDGTDVVVLAGDIGTWDHLIVWETFIRDILSRGLPDMEVVVISGNHEYYGSVAPSIHQTAQKLAQSIPRVHFLDNSHVTIKGRRFLGGTMWFPDHPDNETAKMSMSDFFEILQFTPWVYEQSTTFRDFIRSELRADDIVVTHHLPSIQSVPLRFRRSKINRFFMTDLDDLILDRQPAAWLHGHTHDSCDYTLGTTRVVCNPYGYEPYDVNKSYVYGKLITL